ncbi:hypothetical protein Tco_0351510 [Tanacetum coccineum]
MTELSAIRLRDDLAVENWRSFYRLSLHAQRGLEEILFASVKSEPGNVVSLHVCSLMARITNIQVHNGWRNTWPLKVIQFICENVSGNPSLTLNKRVLQIFAEWSRLVIVFLLSVGCEMKSNFQATIVSYLREWKPTLSLVAFDAAVGYLPHLRRNGEEKVFSVMVVAGIRGKENVEGEILTVVGGVNEDESEAYDIGRDGLVRVARVYGEVWMLAQAEMYHLEYGLAASWEH